ncbi:hypothetical protein B0A48_17828 [Cryoendolithus antarcticus]|uniref:Uncharacterized protein n=1 Tax=Cryoendolithus antarcticus TaxID=1507870 RepID=A0A1V8SAU1_9PEZI|nr:hypothetical protein B0A48_17828 [Cryoendolithus antarcticus]
MAQSSALVQVFNTFDLCERVLLSCDISSVLHLCRTAHLFNNTCGASTRVQRHLFLAPLPDNGLHYTFDPFERTMYTPSALAESEADPHFVPDSVPRYTTSIKDLRLNDMLFEWKPHVYDDAPDPHLLKRCTARAKLSCRFRARLNKEMRIDSSFNKHSSAMGMYLTQPPVTSASVVIPNDYSATIVVANPAGLKFGDVWSAFVEEVRVDQGPSVSDWLCDGRWTELNFTVSLRPYNNVVMLTSLEQRRLHWQGTFPNAVQRIVATIESQKAVKEAEERREAEREGLKLTCDLDEHMSPSDFGYA